MATLLVYSTIAGGFYAQTTEFEIAVNSARHEVGDDVWKRGYSGGAPHGATAAFLRHLKVHGIERVAVEGYLRHVGFVQNTDSAGNVYPKLRVSIEHSDQTNYLLSLDLKGDVAQRMVMKLNKCPVGSFVKISAWPTHMDRDGRRYINHAVSVKDQDGIEVPADTACSARIKELTDGVASALGSAGVRDLRVVAAAKATKRIELHRLLIEHIESRFSRSATAK